MTDQQKAAISKAIAATGLRRFDIWRSESSDCTIVADELAGIVQSNGLDIVEPPYVPMGFSGTGVTLFAHPSDATIESLRRIMSEQLGVEVEREPINEELKAPDGGPIDLRIFIGAKEFRPTLFVQGAETVSPGATEWTVKVSAKPPYGITGSTSWGALVKTKQTLDGQFTVTFSAAAPALPKTAQFNWTVFRYY